MLYTAYVQANKRKVICEEEIPRERAIDFLAETKYGLVIDEDGNEYKQEELKYYAESIRSNSGIREDSRVTSVGEVHEDTDSELFDFTQYYSEPGSKRDN